ncbi:MAG TPA: hypothetical protein VK306_15000 [Acidimicrobiales bacterium]|nr:hypothetical protein [Acidimicrobiales bacterium]
MLFERQLWPGLADGTITVAFRRWSRPRARVGATHRTAAGVLVIDAVEVVAAEAVSDADARRAGHPDRATLFRVLDRYPGGELYRIAFHHAGADPREALRRQADLSDEELSALGNRLARLDRASRHGAWTRATLDAIAERPAVRAGDLAADLVRERLPFKADVRKLKELGLTESLEVGYRLSPRGEAVRAWLSGRTSPTTPRPSGA